MADIAVRLRLRVIERTREVVSTKEKLSLSGSA